MAIQWNKIINNLVKCIDTALNRVVAISFNSESTKLLFINVYMPCDTGTCDVLMVEQFNDVLNEIARLLQSVNTFNRLSSLKIGSVCIKFVAGNSKNCPFL